MRTLLRVVTTRYGIAGLLVLAVLGTVLVTRMMGGEIGNPLSSAPGVAEPSLSIGPDDGVVGHEPTGQPTLPTAVGDPLPIADKFAAAWIDGSAPANQWRDGLRPYATEDLIARLAEVDPSNLPAEDITGKAALTSVGGARWAEATVPTDNGDLVLGLVRADKTWRVDSISFRRA